MKSELAQMSHKVEQIFDAAIAKATAAERGAFLDGACGDDADLRERVEALVRAHLEAGPFLLEDTQNRNPIEGPGERIGEFKILQLIGEGGFGSVYLAEQQSPIRRKVALKIIKLGMDTKQVIARFEAERQALAMMDHANIAKVYDAGATDSGRPYFIMELVRGIPITRYCDRHKLSTNDRLRLFQDVCRAVQHAHNRGIIHRDLKPTNVLVTLHDGTPIPKIIDFGISKATNQRLTEKTLFTEYQQLIGTPQYMSPEQAEMGGLDIDTRSDIYSLGALLYELLTGTPPFDSKTMRDVGYAEMQRIIRDVEPDRPSTRAATLIQQDTELAKSHGEDPHGFVRGLRGDLDWIVTRAMEKDRTRRYDTANELLADITRYLANEPVVAGPPSWSYKLSKFVRRNRIKVAAAALVVTALLTGSILATAGFLEARRDRDLAQKAQIQATRVAEKSQAIADYLQDVLTASDPEQALGLDVDAASAVAKAREVFGADHASVASTLASLALQLQNTGNYRQAEPLFRESIQIWEDNFSSSHVNRGVVLSRLGTLLRLKGDAPEAAKVFQESIRILKSQSPEPGVAVADALLGLAEVYQDQGQYDDAESSLRESLAIRQAQAPHQFLQIALTYNLLANVLAITDQHEKLEPIMDPCVDAFRAALPPDSNTIAKVALQAGLFHLEMENLDKAEGYLKEALGIYQHHAEPSVMNRDIALRKLSQLLEMQDDGSDAFIPKRMEFIAFVRETAGEDHPKLGEFLARAAAYCVEHHLDEQAIQLAVESLEKLQAAYGGEASIKQALVALANATDSIAIAADQPDTRYRNAISTISRFLEWQPDDFGLLKTRGILQYRIGEFDEAVATLATAEQLADDEPPVNLFKALAFLAMANHRIGNDIAAQDALARLQQIEYGEELPGDPNYQRILQELVNTLDLPDHPLPLESATSAALFKSRSPFR